MTLEGILPVHPCIQQRVSRNESKRISGGISGEIPRLPCVICTDHDRSKSRSDGPGPTRAYVDFMLGHESDRSAAQVSTGGGKVFRVLSLVVRVSQVDL